MFYTINFSVTANCIYPTLPIIHGPLSLCDPLIFQPCNYSVINQGICNITSWTAVGGTVLTIPAPTCSTATVSWDINHLGLFYLIANVNTDCADTIYLQDCSCDGPPLTADEIINFSDAYPQYRDSQGHVDLALVSAAIPNSSVQNPGTTNQYLLVNNGTFFIRGQFDVSETPIFFRNCVLYMDKGSVIYTSASTIALGTTFENSQLEGVCDNMWQGIRIGMEGLLIMRTFNGGNQTSLSDAEFGIQINKKLKLYILNCKFFRNYVTLYSPPNTTGSDLDYAVSLIENNEFDGGPNLFSGRYNGQFPLPLPLSVSKTYAAMEFYDLMPNWIGTPLGIKPLGIPFSSNPGTINWFHDLNIGICGENSFINVYNCSFERINITPGYDSFSFPARATAIYSHATNSLIPPTPDYYCGIGYFNHSGIVLNNTFHSVYKSIEINGPIDSDVYNNTIDDNNTVAILIHNANQKVININHNHITNTYNGIFSALNTSSTVNIIANDPIEDSRLPITNLQRYCIKIADIAGSPCTATVNLNHLNSYSMYGIVAQNNKNSTILGNTVYVFPFLGLTAIKNQYGIRLENCNKDHVNCNISGCHTYTAFQKIRSYSNSFSSNCEVFSNLSTNTMFGFEFIASCNPTLFYANQLYAHYDGLILGNYYGVGGDIGPQTTFATYSPGNKFIGTNGQGTFLHAATMSVNSYPSAFWVNQGVPYEPFVNQNYGGLPIIPIVATGYLPFQSDNCGLFNVIGDGDQEVLNAETIILDSISPNSDGEELMKWEEQKDLYLRLREDSSLLDSSIILQNFIDSTAFNNKGRLGDIVTAIKFIYDEMKNDDVPSVIQANIDDAIILNNGINPTAIYELTQQNVNNIILNSVVNGRWELTEDEINSLYEIANSCPYTHGPAVFEARALLNLSNTDLSFDDDDICSGSAGLRKRRTILNGEIIPVIFPNPTNDFFSVINNIHEFKNSELIIYNSFGQKVLSYSVNAQKDLINVNVQSLINGIYTCHLFNNNIDKAIGKLSIIR